MTTFSDRAWVSIAGLMEAIYDLPFNRELASGTLDPARFRYYIQQDSLYLEAYSRALSFAAARAPDAAAMSEFSAGAKTAIAVEQALHAGVMRELGVTPQEVASAEMSPTCAGYTDFLLATAALGSYAELVAAILPCFWIYREVGRHIAERAPENNRYTPWIDTYADEAFAAATDRVIALTDRAHDRASEPERAAMLKAFQRCAQYEWMFWDSAYRMERWPVAVR